MSDNKTDMLYPKKNSALKRKSIESLRKIYGSLSPSTTDRITAVILIIFSILIVFFVTDKIFNNFNIGYVSKQNVSNLLFDNKNNVLQTYEPSYNVKLTTGKTERIINTEGITVKELLSSQGLYPDLNDEINYPEDTVIKDGMNVILRKIDVYEISIEEIVSYNTETIELQTIPIDTANVLREGRNGLIKRNLLQYYVDGELQREEVIDETETIAVINEVVELGVGGVYRDSRGIKHQYSYYVDAIATAYGGPMFTEYTKSGKQVDIGMIAVDPNVIPLGSKCYVVGDSLDIGIVYAEDTGSKIIDKIIDVYMGPTEEDEDKAWEFGRKSVRVYVLK